MLLISIGMFLLCSCGGVPRIPPFKTEFTAEEHVANLIERTGEHYADWIAEEKITSFSVEIMWSFDENPEYFLVELEFKSDFYFWGTTVERAYLTGYIENDLYYKHSNTLVTDETPFKKQGYESEKKYFGGGVWAIKEGEKFFCILSNWHKVESGTFISEYNRKYIATHAYRKPRRPY